MKADVSEIMRALLELSSEHTDSTQFLREVRDALTKHVGTEESVMHVTITTPDGNAGELMQTVADFMKQKFNKEVSIVESKDPSLIGGAVVTFGDEQIDMSVRSALNQAAHSLTQGRTV